MGIFNKTITLGLDYSQFSGGITDVNRKMKLLDEEFNLATQEAKKFGDESDLTRLSQERLAEKIQLQSKKVELSKQAYEKAIEGGKASNKQLDNLQIAYTKNQTELQKLSNEMDEYSNSVEKTEDTQKSFGDTIRGMASSLGLEVSPALESVASKFDGLSAETGAAVLGIGAIITSFAKCTIQAGQFADDLLTLSTVTHISTEELQKMQYASNLLDVDVDVMTGSITKLTNNMELARDGSATLTDQFGKLGIKFADSKGNLRDANEVFYEAIDALGKVKNETERDALAMDLFGKSAKDLNPLIEAGSEALKDLGIQAEDMGMVMGDTELDKLGRFNDAFEEMGKQSDAFKNSLGLTLLPVLTALFESLTKIPVPVLQTLVVLASIVASIVLVVKAIKSMTDTASTIKNFFGGIDKQTLKTTAIVLGVVAALVALGVVIATIMGKSNDLQQSMNSVGQTVGGINSQVSQAQNSYTGQQYNALGTSNFSGGRTFVGENGVEEIILPRGTTIIPNDKISQGEVNYWNVSLNVKDFDDLNKMKKLLIGQKQANRRGVKP